MTGRPGEDTDLKVRIARLSGEAMRLLAGSVTRDCSDIRVTRALEAGLRDPKITPRERKQLLSIAEQLNGTQADDETRSVVLRFRVTDDEDEQIRARADAAGQTISEYLRSAALRD